MHSIKSNAAGRGARVVLVAAALIASMGVVAAKDRQPADAGQYYGLYQSPSSNIAPARSDRLDFDHSGTRGRQGLGESPFNPEGPGNVSD